jgi:hypothetical protein
MLGLVHLQFLDPTFDRTEEVEVGCATELENLAYKFRDQENAILVNFEMVADG